MEGAVVFRESVAMHLVGLVGGGQLCNGQHALGQWHLGGRCCASGGVVWGEAAVQDMVEAVGERRWCNGPRKGCAP